MILDPLEELLWLLLFMAADGVEVDERDARCEARRRRRANATRYDRR